MYGTELHFPEGFLWGTATAAHQVEGNNTNNDWWAWEQAGGHIRNGDRSGIACDWWNRAEEDFDRAQALGQNSHRLSIEWSRLEPLPGEWNGAAFERYRQMLVALRDRGIEPMVTLCHYTLPLWLAARGGWANVEAVHYFARFVERAVTELGDLVRLWCTINEPGVYSALSYLQGEWPPGRMSIPLMLKVMRRLLLAHAEAYRIIHAIQNQVQVGLVKNIMVVEPAHSESRIDQHIAAIVDRTFNVLPLEAVMRGHFRPPLGVGRVPRLADTIDFIGVNYYSRHIFGVHRGDPEQFAPYLRHDGEISDLSFSEVYPAGLYHVLKRVHRYRKPIYVTENGLPDQDDALRPQFLLTHLAQMQRAMQEGVPVRGYYHWSLIDNFEWTQGYSMRFGLIEVDFSTQERRLRRSGRLYGEICQANAITPELVERYAPQVMGEVFPG